MTLTLTLTASTSTGGPGISGLQRLAQNKDTLMAIGGGVYDIVSWDIRGVGNFTM